MYKVLLADDEPAITQSLMNHINWSSFGLVVDAVVTNGTEALSKIHEMDIDIAILDIRMPGMSGLELCKILLQENKKTQVIIVSGYAEFSYAQKALQYGVLGYCLKPVEYDEVTALLIKAVNNLNSSAKTITYDEFIEALEENSIDKMMDFLKSHGFHNDSYYMAVSCSEEPLLINQREGIILNLGLNQYGYIMSLPISDLLIQAFKENAGNKGLGYYPSPVTPKQFKNIFDQCISMSYQYFISEQYRICSNYNFPANKYMSQLSNALSFSDKEGVLSVIDLIGKSDYSDVFHIRNALQLCNMIISSSMLNVDENDYYIYSFKQLVNDYGSFECMLLKLKQLLLEDSNVSASSSNISNTNFLKLIKYINTYYNQALSLSDVAKVMNMNSNYLSQMFKKETGTNFNRYLTDLRMSQAKKLLKTTNISINDISIEVGFNDYFYFLKTFKKFTGKTPSQYRLEN